MANETIDFYLFTDCDIESKKNLFVHQITFEKYHLLLQEKIFSKCVCKSPYKLCDYKPSIGFVLRELLKKYDFWGHCDMDMYFGDIRNFITDNVLKRCERIFTMGFLSLYRNNDRMNKLFMNDGNYPEFNYREVYSTNYPCFFDEYSGMGLKCIRNKVSVFENQYFLDLAVSDYQFHNHSGEQIVCVWRDGKLFEITSSGKTEEKIFVHIQKRKMEIEGVLSNRFVIAPGIIKSTDNKFEKSWFDINQGKNYKRKYWKNRLIGMIKDGSIFWRIRKGFRVKKQFKYEQTIRGFVEK